MAAITSAEVQFRYSVVSANTGGTIGGTAAGSLGNHVSATEWANNGTLFDDISGAENAASTVDYRCIFVYNSNAFNALANATVYISNEIAGGANIALAADPTAATVLGAAAGTAQALTIASETTAPAGPLTYTSPTSAPGVALGSIPAGSVKAFWVRRTATNSTALSGDGVTLSVSGDTGSLP